MLRLLKNKKAFTILEIIVVIFIISLGMVGVLSLSLQNIQIQYKTKNQLLAAQLCQEGIELLRNRRDNNWLNGLSYNDGFSADGIYVIDGNMIQSIPNYGDPLAILKINNGFYEHQIGQPTTYRRYMNIRRMNLPPTGWPPNVDVPLVGVRCDLRWLENGEERMYWVFDQLTDWK